MSWVITESSKASTLSHRKHRITVLQKDDEDKDKAEDDEDDERALSSLSS